LAVYLIRNPLADRQDYLNLERVVETVLRRAESRQALTTRPDQVAERVDDVADVRVLILLDNNSLLVDSRQDRAPAFGPLALSAIRKPRGITLDQSGQAWLTVSRPLENGANLILATPRRGIFSLMFPRRLQELLREDVLPPLTQAGCLALLLALILAYWMSRWISAPMGRIASAAHQVAEGKYEKIRPEGPVEVKQLAQAFNEMSARVRASQQSQREFVANVSHELKTPLTSIQGFAQAIMDGAAGTPEKLHQAAEVIHSEAGRMHRLVLDLLDLARFDAGMVAMELAPVSLPELLKGSVARFEPQARQAQVELSCQAEEMPALIADGDRLAQVMNNLVDNALKYTPAGGQVVVSGRQEGDWAMVTVSDEGPGVPPEDLTRIFERFYQVDKSRRGGRSHGSGLGLAIAQEIVQAHGGSILAQGNQPQGCTIVVKIPFARPAGSSMASRRAKHVNRDDHRAMLQ
jgi:signal transduction histidine kinase